MPPNDDHDKILQISESVLLLIQFNKCLNLNLSSAWFNPCIGKISSGSSDPSLKNYENPF